MLDNSKAWLTFATEAAHMAGLTHEETIALAELGCDVCEMCETPTDAAIEIARAFFVIGAIATKVEMITR